MKKKRLAVLLAGVAVIAAIGGTYAAFVASSDPVEKTVSAPELGIEIRQEIGEGSQDDAAETENGVTVTNGVPGMEIEDTVQVENTEDQDAYIRVTIYKSWTDGNGDKVTDGSLDLSEIRLLNQGAEIREGSAGDWLVIAPADDPEVVYCYYRNPVAAGTSTTAVMDSFSLLTGSLDKNTNQYADKGVKLEFEADAVQTVAAQEAMLAEWGVNAAFSGETITSVTEQ